LLYNRGEVWSMKAYLKDAFGTGSALRLICFAILILPAVIGVALKANNAAGSNVEFVYMSYFWVVIIASLICLFCDTLIISRMLDHEIFPRLSIARQKARSKPKMHREASHWKYLFANVVAMFTMDFVTIGVYFICGDWPFYMNAGGSVWHALWVTIQNCITSLFEYSYVIMLIIAYYMLILLYMIFALSSFRWLYRKINSALRFFIVLVLVMVIGYLLTLGPLLLSPFAAVNREGWLITLSFNRSGTLLHVLLMVAEAIVLFILTAILFRHKDVLPESKRDTQL